MRGRPWRGDGQEAGEKREGNPAIPRKVDRRYLPSSMFASVDFVSDWSSHGENKSPPADASSVFIKNAVNNSSTVARLRCDINSHRPSPVDREHERPSVIDQARPCKFCVIQSRATTGQAGQKVTARRRQAKGCLSARSLEVGAKESRAGAEHKIGKLPAGW